MLSRPETLSAAWDYSSAYKAEDVSEELRGYYQEFSIAKTRANQWLTKNGIPLSVRFKPNGEFEEDSIQSNMELHVFYLLDDVKQYRIANLSLSKNSIRIDCHRNKIIMMVLKTWDDYRNKDVVEGIAKEKREANAAYEAAYAL